MDEPRPFPSTLLGQSITERLAYFRDKILLHPKLKLVHSRLIRAIQYRTAPLIMVYGPTGVGKTTLRLRAEDEIIRLATPTLTPGSIPIASVAANSSSNGNFDWRDFFAAALVALAEPMVNRKRSHRSRLLPTAGSNLYLPGLEPPTDSRPLDKFTPVLELRWDFEQALTQREVGAFIIDEAQHLKQMTSGRRLLDQMNHIKSLANNTTVVYVLIGTYELLDLTNLSGQLSRRSLDIHFPRYLSSNAREMQDFEDIVFNFQRQLPIAEEPDLFSHVDECYEYTAGCVGLLKEWLNNALAETLALGQETMSWRLIRQYAPEERKRYSIALEIDQGEKRLAESGDGTHRADIRRLLGMKPSPNPTAAGDEEEAGIAATSNFANRSDGSLTAKKANRRVGHRKPVRDAVGVRLP